MIEWYHRYRVRKTIRKKIIELQLYIRPGYNIINTTKKITKIYEEILSLQSELK